MLQRQYPKSVWRVWKFFGLFLSMSGSGMVSVRYIIFEAPHSNWVWAYHIISSCISLSGLSLGLISDCLGNLGLIGVPCRTKRHANIVLIKH